jgi:hypothetical protein
MLLPQSSSPVSAEKPCCCPSAPSSVEAVRKSPGLGPLPCRYAGALASNSNTATLSTMAATSHRAADPVVLSAGGCGGNAGRISYAEIIASIPATRPSAGCEQDVLRGLQDVPSRRHPRSSALPMSSKRVRRSAPPLWLRDRCFRCLSRGHRVRSCRDPIRCTRCLHFGHIARFCHAMPHNDESTPLQCDASPPLQTVADAYVPPPPAPNDEASPTDVSLQHILMEEVVLLRSELRDCIGRV